MSVDFINQIRRLTESEYFRFFLIPRSRIMHILRIRRIKRQGCVKIVFIVSSISMWRFQRLYEVLQKDTRIIPIIAVHPFRTSLEAQDKDVNEIVKFFSDKGIQVLNLSNELFPGKVLRKIVDPDIIFYPQPYNQLFGEDKDLDNQYFYDRLICYIPYAVVVIDEPWVDKTLLNNIAWRLFFPTEERKLQAGTILYNKGSNICVTGDPMSDIFTESDTCITVWKEQSRPKKRIIWAPHFSFHKDDWLHRNSFLWLHEIMLRLAERYKDDIQFSFKPHPKLRGVLYETPEWGKARTDKYYQIWAGMESTQLNTGPYIDLFKQSDAIIHDCASFMVEYQFTGRPALFTASDMNLVDHQLNRIGRDALKVHYIADSEAKIVDFIEKTVLSGDDPKKPERESFYQKYLLPPNGQSVAENIYDEILSGLGWKRNSDRL